jgi:hypothetical protein
MIVERSRRKAVAAAPTCEQHIGQMRLYESRSPGNQNQKQAE